MEEEKNSNWLVSTLPITIMMGILFLLAPFYYFPNIGGGGLRIPNNITIWMVIILIISYSLLKIITINQIVLPKQFKFLVMAPVLITLSGFISGVSEPTDWLFRMIVVWSGVLFLVAIFQFAHAKKIIDKVLLIIVISAFINGLIGLGQVYFHDIWPRSFLPQDTLPEGMFQQINNQASYQVTAIFIGFYLLLFKSSTKPKNFWSIVVVSITIFQSSLIIGFSGSRIGWLSLFIGLILVVLAYLSNKAEVHKKYLSLLLAALFIGFSTGVTLSNGMIIDKTEALTSGYSGEARIGIYSHTIDLVKQKPIFGYGIGTFTKTWQNTRSDFYEVHPEAYLPNTVLTHPHNELLFWLFEGGVIALLALLLLIGVVLNALRKQPASSRYIHLALLLPIALHTQVEVPFYVSSIHYFLFIYLLSVVFIQDKKTYQVTLSIMANKSLYALIIVVFVLGQAYLIQSIHANRSLVAYFQDMKPEKRYLLEPAISNPFFSELSMWLLMREALYTAISNNDRDLIKSNIEWTTRELEDNPNSEVFVRLINAYSYLGDRERACTYVYSGLAMFPEAEKLITFSKECDVTNNVTN